MVTQDSAATLLSSPFQARGETDANKGQSLMKRACLAAILFSMVSGCRSERPTDVKLDGITPVFVLSGSGYLANLTISALPPEEKLTSPSSVTTVWRIEAERDYLSGRRVEEIRRLTYGKLPAGYRQVYPEFDRTPQPISPGTIYEFYFETTGAPHARGLFELHRGKAVKLDRLPPCFEQYQGVWRKVPCAG